MNVLVNPSGPGMAAVPALPGVGSRDDGAERGTDFSIGTMLSVIRRWKWLIAAWIVAVMVVVGVVTAGLKPRFRADATLLLDTRTEHVSDVKSVESGPLPVGVADPAVARSEVKILQSTLTAARVIDRLDLANNPDFQSRPGALGTLLRLLGLLSAPPPATAEVARQRLIDEYERRLNVFNDGRSFTFTVSFEAGDAALAAAVANLHVQIYLDDQLALKRDADRRASGTLTAELARLRSALDTKQAQILQARSQGGLITARGATVTASQLADVNAQLVIAQGNASDKAARLAQARGGAADAQSTVLNSSLIQKLRADEAEAQANLSDVSARFGSNYPAVQAARARASDITRLIGGETARIVRSLQDDSAIAARQEQTLRSQLAELTRKAVEQDSAGAQLTQLEQEAKATQSVYDGLFARQREIEGQTGAEAADARLISPAAPPDRPFFPNLPLFMALGFVVAATSGVGVAYVLDTRGTGFSLPEELETGLPIPPMERVPLITRATLRGRPLADMVVDEPRSEFAEAIRSLRADILVSNGGQAPRTIVVTSSLPREGKTTVSLALARSMASFGLQVLLVDLDLRHPHVASAARVSARAPGLIAVLQGRATVLDALLDDAVMNLSILAPEFRADAVQDLLAGPRLPAIMEQARRSFDVVVIDTPPVGAVSDALLIARYAECTLLVVRWRTTPAAIVHQVAKRFDMRGLRLNGTVLNGVDERVMARSSADRARIRRSVEEYYRDGSPAGRA